MELNRDESPRPIPQYTVRAGHCNGIRRFPFPEVTSTCVLGARVVEASWTSHAISFDASVKQILSEIVSHARVMRLRGCDALA